MISTTEERFHPPTLEPLTLRIPDAQRVSGLSRSAIYRALAAGAITAVKSEGSTLVLMSSLRAHLSGLPAATFGSKAPAPAGTQITTAP